ncbi:MAG TPA: hypothetical protein VH186_00460 [Chloroflexia bacterium]|nr:hypothetical protein [Chloroflexia bacterium]
MHQKTGYKSITALQSPLFRAVIQFVCALLIVLLVCLPSTATTTYAQANPKPPAFKVQTLVKGYYRDGNWVTLAVSLQNGPQPWRGEVRALLPYDPQTFYNYARNVNLAAGASLDFNLQILPTHYEPHFDVNLYDENGNQVASQKVSLLPVLNTDYLIGVLSEPNDPSTVPYPGVFRIRPNETRTVFEPVPASLLTDQSIGLTNVNALLLGNVKPEQLTGKQWQNLLGWVEQGGRLWISGGPQFARLSQFLGPGALPALSEGTFNLNRLSGKALPDTNLPILDGQNFNLQKLVPTAAGRVTMLQSGNIPLVAGRALGRGSVVVTAFDLLSPPFTEPDKANNYWSIIADTSDPSLEHVFLKQNLFEMPDILRQVIAQPSRNIPDPTWLLAALFAYIGLMLVGFYYFVRKRNKTLMIYWIGPLLSVMLGWLVWFAASNLGAGEVQINRVAIVAYPADNDSSPATVTSFFTSAGLQRDAETKLQINNPSQITGSMLYRPQNPTFDGGMLQAKPPTIIRQDGASEPSVIESLPAAPTYVQVFAGQGTLESQLNIEAQVAVEPDGNGLIGTIANHSPYSLADVALVLGDNYLYLGDFPAGATQRVEFPFKKLPGFLPRQSIDPNMYSANISAEDPISKNTSYTYEQWQNNLAWTTLNASYLSGQFSSQYESYSLYITGWLREEAAEKLLGQVKNAGSGTLRQHNAALLLKPLPISYQPAQNSSTVLVPAASLVSVRSNDVRITPEIEGDLKIGKEGSTTLQFRLPPQTKMLPSRLSLFVESESQANPGSHTNPQIEIFDWTTQKWVLIAKMDDQRSRYNLTGPEISNFLEPVGGFVRIRASALNGSYRLTQLNLEIEGQKL